MSGAANVLREQAPLSQRKRRTLWSKTYDLVAGRKVGGGASVKAVSAARSTSAIRTGGATHSVVSIDEKSVLSYLHVVETAAGKLEGNSGGGHVA